MRRPFLAATLFGLFAGAISGLSACDKSFDFECTAIWGRGEKELSREIYTFEGLADEATASARCKETMLEDKPPRARAAKCTCVGTQRPPFSF